MRRSFFAIASLVALILIGTARASMCADTVALGVTSIPQSVIAVSLLAFTVSLDINAIGYILTKILPHAGIRGWLQTEWWELAKTAMLIAGIYAILAFASSFAVTLTGAQPSGSYLANIDGLLTSSDQYLCWVNYTMGENVQYLFSLSEAIGAVQSIKVELNTPIFIPVGFTQFEFDSGFEATLNNNRLLLQTSSTAAYESLINDIFVFAILPMYTLVVMQQTLLPVLVAISLTALIPIGLILRAFPFVRGIGGTLIAIGIAIAIIYPAVLIVLNESVTNAFPFLTFSGMTNVSHDCTIGAFCFLLNVAFTLLANVHGSATAFSSLNSLFPVLNDTLGYGAYIFMQFLLLIVDVAIIYPLTDNIARMLGGTVRLQLGGKLKLV